MKILLVLVCATCVCSGFQDTQEWTQSMDSGREKMSALDFAGAAASFQRAAHLAEKLPAEGGELVLAMNGLATAHKQMKRLAEASREYRQAISLSEGTRLSGTATYAYLLASLGAVEIDRGAYDQAGQMLAEAIEIDERTGPQDSVQLAIARQLLGKVKMYDGKYEVAEKLLDQAIRTFRKNPDAPADLLPFALDNLGNLRRLQERPEDALAAFRGSLDAFEQAYGPDHPVLSLELNNLGVQLNALGRKKEARTNFERAVALVDGNEKTDPATKAQILANFAKFLQDSGESREAGKLARRVSAIEEQLPVDVTALGTRSFRKK